MPQAVLEGDEALEPQSPDGYKVPGDEFIADLLAASITQMEGMTNFAELAMNEIAGPHMEFDHLLGLNEAKTLNKPVSVFQRYAAAAMPRICPPSINVSVEANDSQFAAEAIAEEIDANQHIKEIKLVRSLRRGVLRSLFSVGAWLVVPATGIFSILAGEDVDRGDTLVLPLCVDHGNYVRDGASADPSMDRLRAGRIFVSKRLAIKNGFFTEEDFKRIWQNSDDDFDVGQSGAAYRDLVPMWVVVSYERTGKRWGVLANPESKEWIVPMQDWEGHQNGPIVELSLLDMYMTHGRVVSPMAQAGELHRAMGMLAESLIERGIDYKTILAGENVSTEWGQQLIQSPHLSVIPKPASSGTIDQIHIGGVDAPQLALLPALEKFVNESTPNLQQSGGSKQRGVDTATQSEILDANANMQFGAMEEQAREAIQSIIEQVLFYRFYGERAEQTVTVPLRVGSKIWSLRLSPEEQEGDFYDFTRKVSIDVKPKVNDAQKLKMLLGAIQALPGMAQVVQLFQGDLNALMRIMAKFSGVDEFSSIFPNVSAQAAQQIQMLFAQGVSLGGAKSAMGAGGAAAQGASGFGRGFGGFGGGGGGSGGEGPDSMAMLQGGVQ